MNLDPPKLNGSSGSARCQVLVKQPCNRGGASPLDLTRDPDNEKTACAGSGASDHIAEPHVPAHLDGALTIDPDPAILNQPGGKGARLHQPRAPQPFVEPLTFHGTVSFLRDGGRQDCGEARQARRRAKNLARAAPCARGGEVAAHAGAAPVPNARDPSAGP
jgi:hypothetical protein